MYQPYKHCPICGNSLKRRKIEKWRKLACTRCEWIHYENPLPVTVCVARNRKGEILLIRRATPPGVGKWALPGGFIDTTEEPETACLRELKEETAIAGCIKRLIGVYPRKSTVYGPLLLVAYEVTALKGKPVPNHEVYDVAFFAPSALPHIPFGVHRRIIEEVKNKK